MDSVRRFADEKCVVLFDSAAGTDGKSGRYTFLTADPVEVCRIDHCLYGDSPFERFREWQTRLPSGSSGYLPPFCGGVAGLMSYDLGRAFESLPAHRFDHFQTPALYAGLFDWAVVWDHAEKTVNLYVIPIDTGTEAEHRQAARMKWAVQKFKEPVQPRSSRSSFVEKLGTLHAESAVFELPEHEGVWSCFSPDSYVSAAERVIEYIREGDIFQANLAQQLTSFWPGTAVDLYEQVRRHNPAPFGGLIAAEDFSVISASPERFLQVCDRTVETRPIKGTRRRHRSPIADLYTSSELHTSEKDRAENVMIVDLLRNDLSRVCEPGSVRVTGVCEIEIFETVQHLVSTVIGKLRPDRDVWDLCAAAIPGGSVTGAPKIRAMEIIAELEPAARGAYCGNMFYLGPRDEFDSNILIRTFTLKQGVVQFPAGGGIVADSQPVDEYRETMHKAAAMLNCLQSAARPRSSQSS